MSVYGAWNHVQLKKRAEAFIKRYRPFFWIDENKKKKSRPVICKYCLRTTKSDTYDSKHYKPCLAMNT